MNWKRGLKLFSILIAVYLLSSCANTVTFTHTMRDRINLLNDDLKKIQFYVSEKIIIKREFVNWSSEISPEHDLRQIGNHYIETVVINTDTPGIVVDADDEEILVSFEPDPNFYLVFCRNCSEKKKDSDLYTLLTYKVKGRELEAIEDTRLFADVAKDAVFYFTEYGNQDFYVVNNSHQAYLKIKNKVHRKFKKTKRVLPGNVIIED